MTTNVVNIGRDVAVSRAPLEVVVVEPHVSLALILVRGLPLILIRAFAGGWGLLLIPLLCEILDLSRRAPGYWSCVAATALLRFTVIMTFARSPRHATKPPIPLEKP